jgi:cobalt-zinc-cadmium efflux system membrane fusion protein
MRRDLAIFLRTALLAILASACGRPAAEPDQHGREGPGEPHSTSGAEHGEEETGRVRLEGVRGVAFAAVGGRIEEGVWRPAEAMADERERTALAAPAAGAVAAIEVPPGKEVAAGTALLSLRSPELAELAGALLAQRALREQAAADLEREERLAAAGAGAARELEAARAALAVAGAHEEAARLALEARGVSPADAGATVAIRAPQRGRVASYRVLAGAGIEAGQELGVFETGRATLVGVELPLPGPTAWQPGATTTVRRGDGATWQARVEGLPTSVSPETRRLSYRLRLATAEPPVEPPVAGTPLEVRVPLPPGIVVPQDALQQIEGEWGVFLVATDEDVEVAVFTPVRRGPEVGGDVVVLAGLAPGQRIATSGAYLLKALVLKQTAGGEEHAH